jgi:hypothetical protein
MGFICSLRSRSRRIRLNACHFGRLRALSLSKRLPTPPHGDAVGPATAGLNRLVAPAGLSPALTPVSRRTRRHFLTVNVAVRGVSSSGPAGQAESHSSRVRPGNQNLGLQTV